MAKTTNEQEPVEQFLTLNDSNIIEKKVLKSYLE
jgi:hypothetical protein